MPRQRPTVPVVRICVAIAALSVPAARVASGEDAATAPTASSKRPAMSGADYFRQLQKAQKAASEDDRERALNLYSELATWNPDDGELWNEVGRLAARLERFETAAKAYSRAYELGFGAQPRTAFQIATAYGALERHDEALDWLLVALADRIDPLFMVRANKSLALLRDDPTYKQAVYALPDEELSRTAAWQFDLDVLAAEARRMHRQVDHTLPPEQLTGMVDALKQRIEDLTDEEMLFEMQRIIAAIGDGHSRVVLGNRRISVRAIPLKFYLFSDGLFVVDADEEHVQWIGAEVVKVSETPTAEALEAVRPFVSRDNPMGWKAAAPAFLRLPTALSLAGVIGDDTQVPLVLRDRDGGEQALNVAPAEAALGRGLRFPPRRSDVSVPHYLRYIDREFALEWLPQEQVLYVAFNSVSDGDDETLAEFAARVKQAIDEHTPQAVVVDVRHNGGGNTFLTVPLVKTCIYYELSQPGGQLFVIQGRATFSACQNFVTDLDRLTGAIFVGEPSGSRPNSYGETTRVLLPAHQVYVSISSMRWQHSYPMDDRIWIAPDVPALLSAGDYFGGRDPALDAVFEIVADGAGR